MDTPKPFRQIIEENPKGFYGEDWRAKQGDKDERAQHQRNLQRREQGLAGRVDGGSGILQEED